MPLCHPYRGRVVPVVVVVVVGIRSVLRTTRSKQGGGAAGGAAGAGLERQTVRERVCVCVCEGLRECIAFSPPPTQTHPHTHDAPGWEPARATPGGGCVSLFPRRAARFDLTSAETLPGSGPSRRGWEPDSPCMLSFFMRMDSRLTLMLLSTRRTRMGSLLLADTFAGCRRIRRLKVCACVCLCVCVCACVCTSMHFVCWFRLPERGVSLKGACACWQHCVSPCEWTARAAGHPPAQSHRHHRPADCSGC